MNSVYLLCGKPGSGKSTFARRLETERRAFRLSADELMLALFGPHMPREVFEERLRACKNVWLALTERLLAFGSDVSLDWGFWRKAERRAVRERLLATGACCKLIYFEVSDATLLERLRLRNSASPEGTYEITEEMFQTFSSWFEPPGSDEEFQRVAGDGR
jgi:predicted kinase